MSRCQTVMTLQCTSNGIDKDCSDSRCIIYRPLKMMVPVFCVCMISALGSTAGIRHAINMQFIVDADTEYISRVNVDHNQHLDVKEKIIKIK